jgi:uncharacterized protein (DUF433 family)
MIAVDKVLIYARDKPDPPASRSLSTCHVLPYGSCRRSKEPPLAQQRRPVGERTAMIDNGSTTGKSMPQLTRITRDPAVMGGKPCIRGMRVTVGTVVGLVAAGRTRDEILREYPYLEAEDIAEALAYAAWRAEEVEVPLRQP